MKAHYTSRRQQLSTVPYAAYMEKKLKKKFKFIDGFQSPVTRCQGRSRSPATKTYLAITDVYGWIYAYKLIIKTDADGFATQDGICIQLSSTP